MECPYEIVEKILSFTDFPFLLTKIPRVSRKMKEIAERAFQRKLVSRLEIKILSSRFPPMIFDRNITFRCTHVNDGICYLTPISNDTTAIVFPSSELFCRIGTNLSSTTTRIPFKSIKENTTILPMNNEMVLTGDLVYEIGFNMMDFTRLAISVDVVKRLISTPEKTISTCSCTSKSIDDGCWFQFCYDCCVNKRPTAINCAVHSHGHGRTRRNRGRDLYRLNDVFVDKGPTSAAKDSEV